MGNEHLLLGNGRLLLGNERLLLGIIGVFGVFGISFFVAGWVLGLRGSGGPVGVSKISKLRGNTMTGNRSESLREENLPPRGSPRGPPKTSGSPLL